MSPMLSGDAEPGVYRTSDDVEDIRVEAARHGWDCRVLSQPVATKEAALRGLGQALGFAPGFGLNLDALWDSLRDLDEPTLLVWAGSESLDPLAFEPIVDVLQERAEQGGFAVLLAD